MADEYVRFTVRVLPPKQASPGPGPGTDIEHEQPLHTLAIGVKQSEVFEDVWQKIKVRSDARFARDGVRDAQLSELLDSSGADIFLEDTVGSLSGGTSSNGQHILNVRLLYDILPAKDVHNSDAQSMRSKRRASDELDTAQQENVKRRKINGGGRPSQERSLDQQVDDDGFKIPNRVKRPSNRGSRTGKHGEAEVLVKDSQAPLSSGQPTSSFNHMQQAPSSSAPSLASGSSPINAAVGRARASGAQNAQSTTSRKSLTSLPTPESRERQLLAAEARTPTGTSGTGHRVQGWFKRSPANQRVEPSQDATEEDPIEDEGASQTGRVPSFGKPAATVSEVSTGLRRPTEGEKADDVNVQPSRERSLQAASSVRTPSAQPSVLSQTDALSVLSSSQVRVTAKQSARSVKVGWTEEEDRMLLSGVKKGKTVPQILKQHNIDRTPSAARGRHRLLMRAQADGQSNTPQVPTRSEAMTDSEGEGNDEAPPTKRKIAFWQQNEIGILRKAMTDALSMREIQSKHFPERPEESIRKKMLEVRNDVHKKQRRADSFPDDKIVSSGWNDEHNLKLRRAFREGLDVVAAASRYFKGVPSQLVEQKMVAYRQQMADLAMKNARMSNGVRELTSGKDATHSSQLVKDAAIPQNTQESDATGDIEDEVVIQDSYPDPAGTPIYSSQEPRPSAPASSVVVEITSSEQRRGRQTMLTAVDSQASERTDPGQQITRTSGNAAQTRLNFKRDKGKGAARPVVDMSGLDRQYSRMRNNASVVPQLNGSEEEEPMPAVQGAVDSSTAFLGLPHGSSNIPRGPQRTGSSSTVEDVPDRGAAPSSPQSSVSTGGDVSVSDTQPSAQLASELERSVSAADYSTQSQDAPAVRERVSVPVGGGNKPVAFEASRRKPAASKIQQARSQDSEDESPAFQTQHARSSFERQQQKASLSNGFSVPKLSWKQPAKQQAASSESEGEAFQTQKLKASHSKREQPGSLPDGARNTERTLQEDVQCSAPETITSSKNEAVMNSEPRTSASKSAKGSVKARPSAYDIPDRSQDVDTASSKRSTPHLNRKGPTPLQSRKTSTPLSSGEKRRPGQLPRFEGSATRLGRRKKEIDAQIAARKAARLLAAQQSVSQPHVEASVEDVPSQTKPPAVSQSAGDAQSPSQNTPMDTTPSIQSNVTAAHLQVKPTVQVPYPQILTRKTGPTGFVEIGRPGFSMRLDPKHPYLRTEEAMRAEASQLCKNDKKETQRVFEDMKLDLHVLIAATCGDHDMRERLNDDGRRLRRERRIEDGDAGAMVAQGGDLEESSDGDELYDIDAQMEAEQEARNAAMDDDENPIYFDRERHFSEVEDDDDDGAADLQTQGGGQDSSHGTVVDMETEAYGEASLQHADIATGADGTASNDGIDGEAEETDNVNQDVMSSVRSNETPLDDLVEAVEMDSDKDDLKEAAGMNSDDEAGVEEEAQRFESHNVPNGREDDEDMDLPTAPPPMTSSFEEASAVSNGDLQDLVQSGDEDVVEHEESAFTNSRPEPDASESFLAEGEMHLPSVENAATEAKTSTADPEKQPEHESEEPSSYHGTTGITNAEQSPGLSASMLPPWPSSGKVRSPGVTPQVSSSREASKNQKQVDKPQPALSDAQKHGKKRKHLPDDDLVDKKAARKARKKERLRRQSKSEPKGELTDADAQKLLNQKQSSLAPSNDHAEHVSNPSPAHVLAQSLSSKKQKKKKKQNSNVTAQSATVPISEVTPQQPRSIDQKAMPPPSIPVPDQQKLQQSSLPSPSSEASAKLRRRAKKSAKRKQRVEKNRRESMSSFGASVNDSTVSDLSGHDQQDGNNSPVP